MYKYFVLLLFSLSSFAATDDFLCKEKMEVFKKNYSVATDLPSSMKSRFAEFESLSYEVYLHLEEMNDADQIKKYIESIADRFTSFRETFRSSLDVSKRVEDELSYAVRYFKEDIDRHIENTSQECRSKIQEEIIPLHRISFRVLQNLSTSSLLKSVRALEEYIWARMESEEVSIETIDLMLLKQFDY